MTSDSIGGTGGRARRRAAAPTRTETGAAAGQQSSEALDPPSGSDVAAMLRAALPGYDAWMAGPRHAHHFVHWQDLGPEHHEALAAMAVERGKLADHFHALGLRQMFLEGGIGPLGLEEGAVDLLPRPLRSLPTGNPQEVFGRAFGSTLARASFEEFRAAAHDPARRALAERHVSLLSGVPVDGQFGFGLYVLDDHDALDQRSPDQLVQILAPPFLDGASITGTVLMGRLLRMVPSFVGDGDPNVVERRLRVAANSYPLLSNLMARTTTDAIGTVSAYGHGLVDNHAWNPAYFELKDQGSAHERIVVRSEEADELRRLTEMYVREVVAPGQRSGDHVGRSGAGCPVLRSRPHDLGTATVKVPAGKLVWCGMLEVARHTGLIDPRAPMTWTGSERALPSGELLWHRTMALAGLPVPAELSAAEGAGRQRLAKSVRRGPHEGAAPSF